MVGMEIDTCKHCGNEIAVRGSGTSAYWCHRSARGNWYHPDHEAEPYGEGDTSETL